jgi:hypothetical protein
MCVPGCETPGCPGESSVAPQGFGRTAAVPLSCMFYNSRVSHDDPQVAAQHGTDRQVDRAAHTPALASCLEHLGAM